jgi:hypothetical protein
MTRCVEKAVLRERPPTANNDYIAQAACGIARDVGAECPGRTATGVSAGAMGRQRDPSKDYGISVMEKPIDTNGRVGFKPFGPEGKVLPSPCCARESP